MEKKPPDATLGAAGNPPTAQPAATQAAPSTPSALPTFPPGDARHTISTIERSSGRSSGSQEGPRLPDASLGSPLAGKGGRAPEKDEGSSTGQVTAKSSRATKAAMVAGGGRGLCGGESGQEDDDDNPDSEPEFPKARRVLYRASDLMPSSPAGSQPVPAHEHQPVGDALETELERRAAEPPRNSGPPAPAPASSRPLIRIVVKGYRDGAKAGIAHPAPDANKLSKTADDKVKTTAGPERASSMAAPKPGDDGSVAGGEANNEEEADKQPSLATREKPSKKPRLNKRVATSVGQPSGTSGHPAHNTAPLDKSDGASASSTSNQGSNLASKKSRARKHVATAAGQSSAAAGNLTEEPRAQEPGNITANALNEAPELPEKHPADQLGAASVAPAFHAGPPFGSIEARFPNVPLCFDAGAETGRLWYPLNSRGDWEPHWEAWPMNLNHPLIPGKGTCHPSDLTDPDSALPDMIHEFNLSQARDGTLFSSTVETLNWITTASTAHYVDARPQTPMAPQQQLPARPFRFPRSGMNPFVGARLPAAWGRISDLVNASQEPNPLAEGIVVPPTLPRSICDGTEFSRDGDTNTLRVSKEWWESVLVTPTPEGACDCGAAGSRDDARRPGTNNEAQAGVGVAEESFQSLAGVDINDHDDKEPRN